MSISAQLLGRATFYLNFNELYMDSEKHHNITRGCSLFILIANEFVTSCWIAYIYLLSNFFSFNSLVLFFFNFFFSNRHSKTVVNNLRARFFFQTYYRRLNWTFTHVRNFNELIKIFIDLLQATATRLRSLNLSRTGPPPPPLKIGSRTHWSLSCN